VRNALAGLAIVVVTAGPGAALVGIAAVVDPALAATAGCTTSPTSKNDSGGGGSGPSLPVTGTVPTTLAATNGTGQAVTLDHTQLERAATIIAVGDAESVPADGQLVALTASLTESSLRVLSNVTADPASAGYPHDGDGHDHDSLGLFQMRPSTGWGSVADLMDPVWSARAFYGGPDGPNHGSPAGLLDLPGWQDLSPGTAAQSVEDSAYPARYAVSVPLARAVVAALTGAALTGPAGCPGGAAAGGPLPAGFAGALIGAAEKQVGLPYVWGGGTFTGPSGTGSDGRGPGFDCSGLVLYAAYQASGGKVRLPHYTGDQIHDGQPVAWADKQPGDLIFYTYPGASAPHHVVIYLGGDRILQAPQTGQDVGYGTLSEFGDEITTVRRLG
jgi:cell wall-associated NlpC family hydrolase